MVSKSSVEVKVMFKKKKKNGSPRGHSCFTYTSLLFGKELSSICHLKPLPYMPILGSTNSAANKDVMSKILTN